MIKFGYTILYVENVEKAMSFYERAFGFARKFIAENQYGELLTGETTLSFASLALAKSNLKSGFTRSSLSQKPFAIEIGFTTDNVEEAYRSAISQGATPEAEPAFKPHGQTVAYLRDLDGFLIELCTPMG